MAKFPGILTDVLGASNAGPSLGFLDARYLKLDASNDPLTGELELSAGALLPNDASVFFGTDDDIGIKFNSSESRLELGLANTFIGLKENDLGFGTYELELETDIDRVVLPPDIRIEDRVGSEEPSIRLGASTPGDYLRIDYNSVDESWDVVAFGDGGLSFTSQYELSFRTTNETIAFVPAVPEVEFSPAGYSANDKHVTFYLKHYDPSGGASSADLLGVIKIDSNDNESTVDGSFLCEVFATEDHTSSAKGARAVWSLKRAGTEGPGDAAHEALELDADGLSVKDGLEVLGTTTLDTGLTGFLQATSGVVSASATIDISDDTNLATDSTLSLTGDTLGIDLSNANTWTGQQTFDDDLEITGSVEIGSTPAYSQTRRVKVFDDGTSGNARIALIGTNAAAIGPGIEMVNAGSLNQRCLIRMDNEGSNDFGLNFFTTNSNVVGSAMTLDGNKKLTVVGEAEVQGAVTFGSTLTMTDSARIQADNKKLIFGGGQDAEIYYSGSNLIIDPNVVGSGVVAIGVSSNDTVQAGTLRLTADNGGAKTTITVTGVTDTPTTDPGWTTSSTINMNAPNGYIKAYVGSQAVVIPYWNT